MIKELVEFGDRIRRDANNQEDALDYEHVDMIIEISRDGTFRNIYSTDKVTVVEDVIRTEDSGRTSGILPRLLVDNAQYVLGYPKDKKRSNECNSAFIKKLSNCSNLEELAPILSFYEKEDGKGAAYDAFSFKVKNKQIDDRGNIAFLLEGEGKLVHENNNINESIVHKYLLDEDQRRNGDNSRCSICGKSKYRSKNVSVHGVIKRVPDGQTAGCSLVSYNADSFESYDFKGNDNATICTHCIKNYISGLNWLMTNGIETSVEKNGKVKTQFITTNRKNFGPDTAMVFWTRDNETLEEMNWFDKPDASSVSNLIESVTNAKHPVSASINTNQFYSLTLSGAAARIAIRDWIEISLDEYKVNIAQWFKDIRIVHYDFDKKESMLTYPALGQLIWACGRKEAKDDTTISRAAKLLWNCALKNQAAPLWILSVVLKRIAHNETSSEGKSVNTFTTARASLIRFVLNRNHIGGIKMKEELDIENSAPAYLCGRLFSLIEGIQRAALGNDINAGVRERFFSAASASPSAAFGRLMRMMQNHLTKIRQDKPGLAIVLDMETTELCSKIKHFPMTLSLEQQGQFALGYYHQKHDNFNRAKQNKDFETLTDNNTEEQ